MAAILGAAVIGGAASIGGSLISASASKPKGLSRSDKIRLAAQERDKQRALLTADLDNQIAQERLVAAEKARIGVFGRIGDPGTYEENFEDYYGRTSPSRNTKKGLFKTISKSGEVDVGDLPYADRLDSDGDRVTRTGEVLNPNKYRRYMESTRQFRMVSYLTAEADQLIRREGPLWQEMEQSVLGGIYEGAAALHREQAEQIRNQIATGGNARRQGFAEIIKMRAIENTNRQRQQALWQSSLALNQWTRDNARLQLDFNQNWVNNLGGIRDSFNMQMTQLSQFSGQVLLPAALGVASDAQSAVYQERAFEMAAAANKANVGQAISGAGNILLGGALDAYGNKVSAQAKKDAESGASGNTPGQAGGGTTTNVNTRIGAGQGIQLPANAGFLEG